MQPSKLDQKHQRKGELYSLALSIIEAHFPIFAFFSVSALGGLHAYFYSLVIAAILLIAWCSIRQKFSELKRTHAYKNLALTSLFITCLFSLIFLALQTTSPSHVAIILFLQVLFSYLFLGRKPGEKLDRTHLIGVILMTFGALVILFPNQFTLKLGDGLALLAAVIAPFANLFQKRARADVSSETILMVRSIIALPFLYLLAKIFEVDPGWSEIKAQAVWLLLTGGLVFVVSKIFWVEALHRLPITKVTALFAFSPLLTLGLVYFYLDTPPTWVQILGAIPIVIGSIFITQKASRNL